MRTWMTILTLLVACGGSLLEDAKHDFDSGRYAEAKRTLLKLDADEYRSADARTRTTYALYRGLVTGALGERVEAQAWLGLAKQTEDEHPGSLDHEDVARLQLGEEQYGPLPATGPARR